jgi:oxygen-independent coproporphyrinogen-3 oxidase
MVKAQRQGTLQRNFQGYSTHADTDLVAIGVSSISSVCDSFSQNSPKMDEYREKLVAGKLPVIRGLIMTDEDRLRREVITQLICHFRLDINRLEKQWDINFHQYFHAELEELQEMQDEGLISVHDDGIIVEDKGRMLIRNICMVFDAYLRDNVVQFSKVI